MNFFGDTFGVTCELLLFIIDDYCAECIMTVGVCQEVDGVAWQDHGKGFVCCSMIVVDNDVSNEYRKDANTCTEKVKGGA